MGGVLPCVFQTLASCFACNTTAAIAFSCEMHDSNFNGTRYNWISNIERVHYCVHKHSSQFPCSNNLRTNMQTLSHIHTGELSHKQDAIVSTRVIRQGNQCQIPFTIWLVLPGGMACMPQKKIYASLGVCIIQVCVQACCICAKNVNGGSCS